MFVGGVELRTVNRKLVGALAILSLTEGRRRSRDQVASLLWSESGQGRARGSLRQMVTAMRRDFAAAGFAGLDAPRNQLALSPGLVRTDVDDLLDRAATGETDPALLDTVDLPASLMRGWDDVDPAFAEWLQSERERLRERLRRALSRLILGEAIERAPGRDAAQALLRLDPTQERVAQRLMASLARGGDGTAALAVYADLRRMLDQFHDAAPSRETQTLAARIRAGDLDAETPDLETPDPSPSRAGAPDAALRIEPFTLDGGGQAERAALDGLRDQLIGALIRFREWRVTEAPEGGPSSDGAHAADDARFGLRASARLRPGGLAISMTLRELATGEFLWSEAIDLDVSPGAPRPDHAAGAAGADHAAVAAGRERMLRQLVIALNVRLSRERSGSISAGASLRDTWLRGQRMILNFDPESWLRVREEMRDLVARAPDYAPAWSALAQVENSAHVARPGVMREPGRAQAAMELALRAVTLDPLDSRARLALGWAQVHGGRWGAAADAFDMAMQLNPHDAWILTSVAQAMAVFGRHDLARSLADAALEAAPLRNQSRWGYHAAIRLFAGDYEGALEAGILAADSHANSGAWRAAALAHLGRLPEARAEAERLVERLGRVWAAETSPDPLACARWVLGVLPTRHEAEWLRLRDGLALAGLPAAGLRWPGPEGRGG